MTFSTQPRRRTARSGAMLAVLLCCLPPLAATAALAVPVDGARRCDSTTSDTQTTAAVVSRLQWNAALDAADINVTTSDGRVELRGLARSDEQKRMAGTIALDTIGAARVINQIDVNDWTPRTETARLGGISRKADRLAQASQSDRWLSAAVGYTLSFSRSVDSCAIAVTATDSVVALRGRATSPSARAAAIAAAESTIGVRSVEAEGLVVD